MASKRIQGITIEIGGDTTKLQTALRGVDKQLRTTQGNLKDIDKLLKFNPGNTELLSQKQRNLQTEIKSTSTRLGELKKAQYEAMTTDQYDGLQREIIETENKLQDLKNQYKEFGSVAKQQIKVAAEKMQEVGRKISGIGDQLTQKVTMPLVAVGAAGVASFAEVDKTMQLTNKTMGNTEDQAQLLNKAMKDAAANSTFGMKDAATATLNFARAGLDAEEAASALAPAMNLAAGEGGNLDTVSSGLVATINGFHGSFDEAEHYADVFAAACNNSALDVDSLSHAMSVAAPIFSAAGYNVNDAALYMGVMANNGIEADKAANSLKTGLARLVSPAKDGAEKMAELGISVTNADGSMKDSVTVQRELHDAFSKLSESEQIAAASAIFGKNQMAPWLALINTAPEDVGALDASLASCAGTTTEMAEAMMSGFGGSIEQLKSSLDVLVTSIGEALAPSIQTVITFIQGLVDKFNALSPAQQETIVKIGAIVAAIGPVLAIGGRLITGIGTVISLLTGPVGIAVAIGAVVAVIVTHWEEIKTWAANAAAAISEWFEARKTALTAWFEERKTAITTWFEERKKAITEWFNSAKATVEEKLQAISTGFKNAVDNAKLWFENLGKDIKAGWDTYFQPVVNWLGEKFNGAIDAIKTVMNGIVDFLNNVFSGNWEAAWNNIVSGFGRIFSGVGNLLKTPINAIIDGLNWMIDKVESAINGVIDGINDHVAIHLAPIDVPVIGRVFPGLDWSANLQKVDWGRIDKLMATGGVLQEGQRAIVGEHQPEYLRVVNGRAIVTPMTNQPARLGGNQTVNITINAQPGQSAEQIAAAVKRVFVREMQERSAAYA